MTTTALATANRTRLGAYPSPERARTVAAPQRTRLVDRGPEQQPTSLAALTRTRHG